MYNINFYIKQIEGLDNEFNKIHINITCKSLKYSNLYS